MVLVLLMSCSAEVDHTRGTCMAFLSLLVIPHWRRYEPFLDLSLPLTREGKGGGGLTGWFSGKSAAAPSIQDCLQAFTADETMQV